MQGRIAEAAGAAAAAAAASAVTVVRDIVDDDRRLAADRGDQHTATHTKPAGGGPASLLAPDDPACILAGIGSYVASSAAIDAAVNATDDRHVQRHRSQREARAMRAL